MQPQDVAQKAEAILFAEGIAVPFKKLASEIGCDEVTLLAGLDFLGASLASRGIALVKTDKEAGLAVSPACREMLENIAARETGRDIGDAGLEVLGVLLYRGPSTRSQIDYIRGVNSSSTLRGLLARGLVERAHNPEDAREYLYRPTVELLAFLGIRERSELPEYATIAGELAAFEAASPAQTGDVFNGTEHGTPRGDAEGHGRSTLA